MTACEDQDPQRAPCHPQHARVDISVHSFRRPEWSASPWTLFAFGSTNHRLENGLFCCLTAHWLRTQRWLHYSMALGNIYFRNADSTLPAKLYSELWAVPLKPRWAPQIPVTQERESDKAASSCLQESASSPGMKGEVITRCQWCRHSASQTLGPSMCLTRKYFGSQGLINNID